LGVVGTDVRSFSSSLDHTSELTPLLFSFDGDLLSDLLFDLLESLQEKLLDFRSLVEHNLSQGSDILELS
jgi:hypothetical protein